MSDLLQELSSTSDSDSSGDESAGEEDKKEDAVDEDDQAEQAKLPQYVDRFKVGVVFASSNRFYVSFLCQWGKQMIKGFLSWPSCYSGLFV